MNTHRMPRRDRGISLIDAMLAMVILAGGLVAVAQFQGGLIASSGQTKARAEAVQLAQDKIEQLRNLVLESQYTGLTSGSDQVTGVNATFARSWTATPGSDSDRTQIQVSVTWTDPRDGQQSVNLTSVIAWNDPKVGINIASGTGGGGGFIQPSTGRATTDSDKTYTDDAGNLDLPDGTDNGDGTMDYVTDGGERELIDTSTGEVLLTVSDGSAFSTISGTLYFDWEVSKTPDPTKFFIMTSDAAYCTMDNTSVTPLPDTSNPSYQYFDYTCYVGAQWYGNVGVVSTDRTNNQNRVCVGDPTEGVQYNDDGTITSTSDHPALSTIRTYRGYVDDGTDTGTFISAGIGMSSGDYSAAQYTDHDFLVTTITGDAVDSECQPPMQYLNPGPFNGNPGDFVCLTDTCPETLPTGEPPTTTFTGTITAETDYTLPGNIGLDITAGTCSLTAQPNANNPQSYDYECEINWLGWTGGTWEGEMTLTGADVCGFSYTQPDDITLADGVIYLDNTYGNTIGFTEFPPEVVTLSMDVTVAPTGSASTCR